MKDNNITRSHIALEVMKIILQKQMFKKPTLLERIKNMFRIKCSVVSAMHPDAVAEIAYRYADAMIAERDNTDVYKHD